MRFRLHWQSFGRSTGMINEDRVTSYGEKVGKLEVVTYQTYIPTKEVISMKFLPVFMRLQDRQTIVNWVTALMLFGFCQGAYPLITVFSAPNYAAWQAVPVEKQPKTLVIIWQSFDKTKCKNNTTSLKQFFTFVQLAASAPSKNNHFWVPFCHRSSGLKKVLNPKTLLY